MIAVRATLSKAAPLLAVAGLLGIWQLAALILNTDSFPSALDGIRAIPAILSDRGDLIISGMIVIGVLGFLSDKVVVMTRAPGRIKEIVEIDLPRPRRRAELLLDPRYQKYVVDIERLIDDTGIDELHP